MIKIGLNMVAILATLKPKYVSGLLSDSTTDCHGPFCSHIPIILLVLNHHAQNEVHTKTQACTFFSAVQSSAASRNHT